MNMLTSYSILHQGWYKTIILLIQLDPTDLQQLLVREDKEYSDEKEKINNEKINKEKIKEKIKEKKNTIKRTKSEYNQVDEDNEESMEVPLEA